MNVKEIADTIRLSQPTEFSIIISTSFYGIGNKFSKIGPNGISDPETTGFIQLKDYLESISVGDFKKIAELVSDIYTPVFYTSMSNLLIIGKVSIYLKKSFEKEKLESIHISPNIKDNCLMTINAYPFGNMEMNDESIEFIKKAFGVDDRQLNYLVAVGYYNLQNHLKNCAECGIFTYYPSYDVSEKFERFYSILDDDQKLEFELTYNRNEDEDDEY